MRNSVEGSAIKTPEGLGFIGYILGLLLEKKMETTS